MMDDLKGTPVLVHPELSYDPAGKQNQVGIIREADLMNDDVFLSFNGKLALYPAEALFVLLPNEEIHQNFDQRPSPTELPGITGNVVIAILSHLLHNYLLPRDCPRVTFYASENTTPSDKNYFFGNSNADFVIIAESNWYQKIKATTLYRYEFRRKVFQLSMRWPGTMFLTNRFPVSVTIIDNCIAALLSRER